MKKILCKEFPETLKIKQIAIGFLRSGEEIRSHVHPDFDEYYYVLEGSGRIFINNEKFLFVKNVFVKVPAGAIHRLTCKYDLCFFYFGVQILEGD